LNKKAKAINMIILICMVGIIILTFLPTFVFTWKASTAVGTASMKFSFTITGVWVTADYDLAISGGLSSLLDDEVSSGDTVRLRITEKQAFDIIYMLTDDNCPRDLGEYAKAMGTVHCTTLCITLLWMVFTFLLTQDDIKHRLVIIPFVTLLHTALYFVTPLVTSAIFESHKSDWFGNMISSKILPSAFSIASIVLAAAACAVYIKYRWFDRSNAEQIAECCI